MVHVHIVRDKNRFIWEFSVKGHAGYGRQGKDIVCAAVSAIAYTALGALQELVGFDQYIEQNGFLKCSIPSDITGDEKYKTEIILETMVIGMKQIEMAYKKHVVVLDEEV